MLRSASGRYKEEVFMIIALLVTLTDGETEATTKVEMRRTSKMVGQVGLGRKKHSGRVRRARYGGHLKVKECTAVPLTSCA